MKVFPENMIVGVADCATLFGVSERSLHRFRAQGLPTVGRGRYHLPSVYRWFAENATAKSRDPDAPLTPRDELAIAQRRKVELETAQLRDRLLPADQVREVFDRMSTVILAEMDRLPEVAEALLEETNPTRAQVLLHAHTRALRREIAAGLRTLAEDVTTGKAFEG